MLERSSMSQLKYALDSSYFVKSSERLRRGEISRLHQLPFFWFQRIHLRRIYRERPFTLILPYSYPHNG